jgi:hypothetical protein
MTPSGGDRPRGAGLPLPGISKTWVKPPEAVAIELSRAFPAYTVRVRWDRGEPRFEARARDDRYPNCLISPDAEEIRAVLNGEA